MTTFSRSEFWASLGEDSPRIGLRTCTCRATFLRTASSSEVPCGLSGFVSNPEGTLEQLESTGEARGQPFLPPRACAVLASAPGVEGVEGARGDKTGRRAWLLGRTRALFGLLTKPESPWGPSDGAAVRRKVALQVRYIQGVWAKIRPESASGHADRHFSGLRRRQKVPMGSPAS